jgi:hypothetical protein
MNYQLVRITNNWNQSGCPINVVETVVETFGSLSVAVAQQNLRTDRDKWGADEAERFEVRDPDGKRYVTGQMWEVTQEIPARADQSKDIGIAA